MSISSLDHYQMARKAYYDNDWKKVLKNMDIYLAGKGAIDERGMEIMYQSYRALKQYENAEKVCRAMLKVNPNSEIALFSMGKLYAEEDKNVKAERYLLQCMEINPNSTHAMLEMGKLRVKSGKYEEAEQIFKKCIEIDKDNTPYARQELGSLYSREQRDEEAIEQFKKSIEIEEKKGKKVIPFPMLRLGKIYAKKRIELLEEGNKEEAEKYGKMSEDILKKCISINNDKNVYARMELGILYMQEGRLNESQEILEKNMKASKSKKDVPSMSVLARVYGKEGKIEQARALLDECIKLNPNDQYVIRGFKELEELEQKIASKKTSEEELEHKSKKENIFAKIKAYLKKLTERNAPKLIAGRDYEKGSNIIKPKSREDLLNDIRLVNTKPLRSNGPIQAKTEQKPYKNEEAEK